MGSSLTLLSPIFSSKNDLLMCYIRAADSVFSIFSALRNFPLSQSEEAALRRCLEVRILLVGLERKRSAVLSGQKRA